MFRVQRMSGIDKWGIDVFCISDLTDHRPLTAIAFTVLQVNFDTAVSMHQHSSYHHIQEHHSFFHVFLLTAVVIIVTGYKNRHISLFLQICKTTDI